MARPELTGVSQAEVGTFRRSPDWRRLAALRQSALGGIDERVSFGVEIGCLLLSVTARGFDAINRTASVRDGVSDGRRSGFTGIFRLGERVGAAP